MDFDRSLAAGVFQRVMHLAGASEVVVVPYLTFLSAVLRFSFLLVVGIAVLTVAGRAAMAAALELRKFLVLFRCLLRCSLITCISLEHLAVHAEARRSQQQRGDMSGQDMQ